MRLEHLLSGVAVDVGFTDGDFEVRVVFLKMTFSWTYTSLTLCLI